jgi:hypothetical protein
MQESPGADPTAEAAGFGRGQRRLVLTAERGGSSEFEFLKLRWLVFDEICSYGITATRGTCLY